MLKVRTDDLLRFCHMVRNGEIPYPLVARLVKKYTRLSGQRRAKEGQQIVKKDQRYEESVA